MALSTMVAFCAPWWPFYFGSFTANVAEPTCFIATIIMLSRRVRGQRHRMLVFAARYRCSRLCRIVSHNSMIMMQLLRLALLHARSHNKQREATRTGHFRVVQPVLFKCNHTLSRFFGLTVMGVVCRVWDCVCDSRMDGDGGLHASNPVSS